MSQSSTSNKSSLPRLSAIPRPSRLPVSRNTFEVPPVPQVPSRYQASPSRSRGVDHERCEPEEPGQWNENADKLKNYVQGTDLGQTVKQSHGEEQGQLDTHVERRRPRPSLSDRTIETLSQLPPSPSPRRRKSSFFPSESPDRNVSRPASSLSRPRPSTSHGHRTERSSMAPPLASPIKSKQKQMPSANVTPSMSTPSRRAVSSYMPKSVPHSGAKTGYELNGTPSKQGRPTATQTAAVNQTSNPPLKLATGSKSLAVRSSKPRLPLTGTGTFKKPEIPTGAQGSLTRREQRDVSNHSTDSVSSIFSPTSRKSSQTSHASNDSVDAHTTGGLHQSKLASSAALRETIAKAKAAHRKAAQSSPKPSSGFQATEDDILYVDSNKDVLRKRVETARLDGRLNIAALDLTEIPSEVVGMYDLDSVGANGGNWYESVDITRLIAADNRFELLGDNIFPDRSVNDLRDADEEATGTLFGGLDTLDLHGNLLGTLPIGLRQLAYLKILNLSKNKLSNDCFNTLAHVETLHELRLADNYLQGALPSGICKLKNLQILDVHNNKINELPDGLQDLLHLRILNAAGNQLRSAPVESLSSLPLVELDLSCNRLGGSLLGKQVEGFLKLQILDVSKNSLKSLTEQEAMNLPDLRSLNVSENCLQSIPNISVCDALTNLAAANNALTSLPEGMAALRNLKNVDLMCNNIKKLEDDVGTMSNLSMLNIANNPLRERRFLTMNTEDLKHELRKRLVPPETDQIPLNQEDTSEAISQESSAPSKSWSVKPGGVLDRSSTSLSTINSSDLEPLLSCPVRSVVLHHNSLDAIPSSLCILSWTITTLDLSHNRLTGSTYLSTIVSFPTLRDLNLASNTITSLEPIIANLTASRLENFNIGYNRLTVLPRLVDCFPALVTVVAPDNQIRDLPIDSVRGLQVCNVARNDVGHLEPQLGLLETEGLRTLVVEGNRFRVPRRDIVEGGTERLLAWLRGRIPD